MRDKARPPHRIIDAERTAYLDALPPPDPDWPPDVRVLYEDLHDHLFEAGLTIGDVKERCGIGNHNVSSRFKWHVGNAPKRYITYHRLKLAKELLRYEKVSVTQVAFGVGYNTPNAFSAIFKRWANCTPSEYQNEFGKK